MPYSTEYIDSPKGQSKEYGEIPFLLSNLLLLEEKNKYDLSDMIIPFFNLHPENRLDKQLIHIKKLIGKEGGFRGVKYHCQATNTHISSIGNEKILHFCRENNLPILLHTGVSKNRNAFNILPLIRENSDICFSIAHL